jgi:hypothetical protein
MYCGLYDIANRPARPMEKPQIPSFRFACGPASQRLLASRGLSFNADARERRMASEIDYST